MATGDGTGAGDLTLYRRFARSPDTHHIFLALRIIEAQFADAPPMGQTRRPRQDAVRLGQEPETAFPATTILSFRPPDADGPGRLTNRFFGLFGPNGPLPLHLTEYARERLRNERDPTLVAFADMLTHRLMGLLYRAWTTGQPAASFDRGAGGRFDMAVAALAGRHGAHLQGRDAMPDAAKRHFAGLLGQGPRNAEGLVAILSAFLAVPVRLEEFVGCWLQLEPSDRWQLGAPSGLGRDTSLGSRVWSRSARFRLVLGPMPLDDYRRLLPGGASLRRLRAIVRNYAGDALDWDVQLILRAADVPRAILGRDAALGLTTWSGTRHGDADAGDLILHPMSDIQDAA